MSKLLKRLNDNQNKVADTNGIMKLQAWDYGVAQDLTNKQITATVANASGFLFDLDLESNGTEIDLDFKDSQLQKLAPDTYFLEIKVTDEAGDVSVFPTEGYATFTINKNLHATEGALVPQITFDTVLADVKKAMDKTVAEYVKTIAKGDKGDTGPAGKDGYMPIVGGTNLIRSSEFDRYWSKPIQATTVDGYNGHKAIHVDITGWTGNSNVDVQQSIYNADVQFIKSGEWYTISFYAKGKGTIRTHIYPSVIDISAGSYTDGVFSSGYVPSDGSHDWALTDEYVRHSWSFKARTTLSPTTNSGIMLFRTMAGNSTYVSLPKLEKGNIATDWSPAPEDVQSDISKRAIDTSVVHNTGDETVAGNKTLTGLTTMLTGNYGFRVTSSGVEKTTDGGGTWVKGDIGPKGDKGDIGPKGDKGDIGPKGDTGPQGPAGKDPTDELEAVLNNKLSQISSVPEAFANLGALKNAYPNGKTGIFVTADNGHKYIWANSTWTDAGVYQSTGIGKGTITNSMLKDGVKTGRIVAGSPVVLSVIDRTLTLGKIYRLLIGSYSVKPNKAAYTFKLSDDQSGFYLYYDSATGDISVTSDALPDTGTLLGWLNLSGSATTYDISASSVMSDVENPYVKPIDRIPFTSNGNTPINISTADRTMKVDVRYFNVYYANEAFKIANTGTIDLDTGTTATFLYFDTATQAFITKDSTNGLLPPTYIYLGAIDWAYPLNSKLYFPATFDGVDIFRMRHSDKYAELVAGYVIEVNFENKTMTLDKSGYASLQFEDSAYNIKKYNEGNVDISAGGASMSFLFVDVSTNKIQAYGAKNAAPISALYLGWIDWANYDWNVHFKLKIAGNNRDTKSLYKFGRSAVTFFGDSITVANNVDRPWTAIVANALNTSATKNGWSGTTYTSGNREHSAVDRVDEITNQDLVVVEFGVNDFHYGRPLGQFGDTDTSKLYGALDFVYNKLITNNPTAKFVIMTPMKNHGYGTSPDSFTENSDGHYQIDYVNAIKQVADKYSLPVLDMYANSGISAMNETHNKKYLFDGLHPNQEGSFIVASKVIGFINSQI